MKLETDGYVLTESYDALKCCQGALKYFGLEDGERVDQETTIQILTYNLNAVMEKLSEIT